MRVVIDCNVLISAALSKNGTAAKAIRVAEDFHQIILSENTLREFSDTILKTKFDKYFRPVDVRFAIVSRYSNKCELIEPFHRVAICRDPKDDMYLELALSGKADCIITGDPDLWALHPFENIPIISPAEFLDRYS
ncbi:MAG: putative toxin-antitoxin system toxin component, PIN family [Cyclobacteriaceae bacterium]|nr:putative toxin-antitoxin system toxin component, PIN family [Cyclobacteriaceae bacterium]